MSARRAVSRPPASTPVVKVRTAACLVVVSMLSSKVRPRRTGTPASRAISATSGSILQYDLPPKPPPTAGRVEADVVQLHAEHPGDVGADDERVLVAGPQFHPLAGPARDVDVRFQMEVVDAGEREAVGEDMGGGRQRSIGVTVAEGVFAQHVLRRFGDVGGRGADRGDRAARRACRTRRARRARAAASGVISAGSGS